MRPLRNHPLLLLNSEFSSHNTKVTAILFALAPADFAPLRPPMPAHACIRLHYRRLPAAIRLFVRLCRLTPAYGSRFCLCRRSRHTAAFSAIACGNSPLRSPMPAHACIRLTQRYWLMANTRCYRAIAQRAIRALCRAIAQRAIRALCRAIGVANTRSLSRYWRRQYALLAQLLALPIRWAWRTKCAFALNGKGDNHYKTTFGTFQRIGAIYLCH